MFRCKRPQRYQVTHRSGSACSFGDDPTQDVVDVVAVPFAVVVDQLRSQGLNGPNPGVVVGSVGHDPVGERVLCGLCPTVVTEVVLYSWVKVLPDVVGEPIGFGGFQRNLLE